MNKEEYLRNRKMIFLCSITITSFIVVILFRKGRLFVVSDRISDVIAAVFVLISYYCFLKLALELKKVDVHGLQAVAWATLLLYIEGNLKTETENALFSLINTISIIGMIFFLIDGIIRFIMSLILRFRKMDDNEDKIAAGVESVVATLTSIIAIIISLLDI